MTPSVSEDSGRSEDRPAPRASSALRGGQSMAQSGLAPGADRMALPLWRRLLIFLLLLCSEFLYGWAWNSVDVLRPLIKLSLHLSLIQAGSLYSAQGAGALCGAVIMGQLADRLGRKNVLAVLVAGYGMSLIAGAFVASYPEIVCQRLVLGFFMGGVFPVAVGIYVTLFEAHLRGRLAGSMNALFSLSIVLLGFAVRLTETHDWRLLLWLGGLPALMLSPVVFLVIPDERIQDKVQRPRPDVFPIRELFGPALWRRTVLLALMTGLNFFGYQAFTGWLTVYLTSERGLSNAVAGELIAFQFTGNIIGGFLWGWAADRFGRRFNALGFVIAAFAIVLFLAVPTRLPLLLSIGFIYGGALCASLVWGPWLAELYPAHLRSTAASIFNWGRIISFFAPLITASLASVFGLRLAMLSASVAFLAAAAIWRSQPETVPVSRRRAAGQRRA